MAAEFFTEVAGCRLIQARITIPPTGCGWVDWTCDEEIAVPTEPVRFIVGDLRLLATPYRQGSAWLGSTKGRAIFGHGGWRKPLPPKFYAANPKASTVLGDAARECGERLAPLTDRVLGRFFTREGDAPAQRVLATLFPRWWMDLEATTHTTPRVGTLVAERFDVQSYDSGRGRMSIATEKLSEWLPWNRFESPQAPGRTIACVIHHLNAGSIRTEVLW